MTEVKKRTVPAVNKKTIQPEKKSDEIENIKLDYEKKLKELMDKVSALAEKFEQKPQPKAKRKVKFDLDDDVVVISLCNHTLNLSTDPYKNGKNYMFTEFGEEKVIPYSHVKEIINNNMSFLRAGLFYIDNSDAIESLRISGIYDSMVPKDVILNLFNENSETFVKVFSMMSSSQKDIFASMIIDRIVCGENIDLNVVQKCSEILGNGRNLMLEAATKKESLSMDVNKK